MNYPTQEGKVSRLSVALITVGLIIFGVFVLPIINSSNEIRRFENEIDRVAKETKVQPSLIECRNVEFANICYAEYSSTSNNIKRMLETGGYSVEISKSGNISATNQSTSIRVSSEPDSENGKIILKFKNINVTL